MATRREHPDIDSRPMRRRDGDSSYQYSGSGRQRASQSSSYAGGQRSSRTAGQNSYSNSGRTRSAGNGRYAGERQDEEARRRAAARKRERQRRKKRKRNMLIVLLLLILIAVGASLYFLFRSPEEEPPVNFNPGASVAATQGTVASGDTEPPVISGVQDQTVFVGDSISYKKGVTVTDNLDSNVQLDVDTSQIDLNTAGTYTVTYSATDAAGNKATATATITVEEKPAGYENKAEMESMAKNILDQIITSDMTEMEKAQKIYNWCHGNIGYVNSSDKSSWINGAIQAFETHSGDCFNYFAAAKALLTQAGIENMDVVKSDTSHSSHYWSLVNCGDGWYHFDTTPRKGDGDYFFMVTDDQLEGYSKEHDNSHIFDHSLYPATSTKVITDLHARD
ncbi:immunoglobulin-like domain-containing protein [Hominifimenecus sp. rT4P-3]|uniref:immunoglobulin-like domain-containing protein n=1 Tax=Hominifimenecus sp. rT4P-3 TaxID=3242979 RepID=UPI003DA2B6D7